MKNTSYLKTDMGQIIIIEENNKITEISFDNNKNPRDYTDKESSLIKEVKKQLQEYFKGQRKTFDFSIEMKGTPFQRDTWNALLEIPYGETRSYKEIAEAIGRPKAYRAVGMANNRNSISIVVPCHRVIGANGSLVGYGGGLEIKEALLNHEKSKR